MRFCSYSNGFDKIYPRRRFYISNYYLTPPGMLKYKLYSLYDNSSIFSNIYYTLDYNIL